MAKTSTDNSNNSDQSNNSDNSNYSNLSEDFMEDDLYFMGKFLNNKYITIYKLGCGAFASVWLSFNILDELFYAIKIQNPDDIEDGETEVALLKKIKETNCKFINCLVEDFIFISERGEHICMVFKLLAGSLYDIMKGSNGFPYESVKIIIYQLLIALDNINRKTKIMHTDLKPENILIVGLNNKIKCVMNEFLNSSFKRTFMNKRKKFKIEKAVLSTIQEVVPNLSFSKNENVLTGAVSTIDEKYLHPKNIQIRLSDFGSACYLENKNIRIQTRYYRAPEIILEYDVNEKSDIWSVGCLIYELLTGEILFNPDKKRRFNRDRHHLYDIQSILGKLPEALIQNSKKGKIFFRSNGSIKGKYSIRYKSLSNLIQEKLKEKNIPSEEIYLILDLLYKMFDYNHNRRPKACECLNHKWFQSIK